MLNNDYDKDVDVMLGFVIKILLFVFYNMLKIIIFIFLQFRILK